MKTKILLAAVVVLLAITMSVRASYSYVDTEDPANLNLSNWTTGCIISGGGGWDCTDSGYLYNNYSGGGEVDLTIRLPGPYGNDTSCAYFGANSLGALDPNAYASFYFACFSSGNGGQIWIYQSSGGSLYFLGQTSHSFQDGSVFRVVTNPYQNIVGIYVDNVLCLHVAATVYGYMGFGQYPSNNYLSQVSLGALDSTAPNTLPTSSIQYSSYTHHIDIQWSAASDDTNGTGIYQYQLYRGGSLVATIPATASLSFSDTNLVPNTTYNYTLTYTDFHFNSTSTNFSATTLPVYTQVSPSYEPEGRRTGVRPTGAYWGASPENIDVLSGNLNFALPLLGVKGRSGWGVGFNLVYNSQNWRQDSGGIWQWGGDVGYGYGWRLMAGSITPIFINQQFSYHLFTDSTGAEYKLDQNNGNIWSSKESIYVWFDANTNILHFRDGSFWYMGCSSSEGENDQGTMYPTLMEDTNGNQVLVTYASGINASWTNSSARVSIIEDVRAHPSGSAYVSYSFTYNKDTPPHLTSISNNIGTGETYSFSYSSQSLYAPFNGASYGTVTALQTATASNIGTYHQFTYDSSGELTQALLPYKGYLAYDYTTTTYSSSRSYREVAHRYLSKDGSTQTTYPFTHESSPGPDVHQYTILDDPGGLGEKYWAFNTTGTYEGLVSQYQGRHGQGGSAVAKVQNDFTWSQDGLSNSFISSTLNTSDPGQSYQAQSKTTQSVDNYGNVTQVNNYAYGNLSTPARTSNYGYLNSSPYTSRYILNRITGATVTDGTNTVSLASVSYDGNSLTTVSGQREWDSAYSSSLTARGNPTSVLTPGTIKSTSYSIVGSVTSATVNGVTSSVSTTSTTNYAAPDQMTVGSLSASMSYSSFLGLTNETGPNGDSVSLGYDSNARPSSSTSPFGATTSTTYSDTSSPPYTQTSVNGRWTKTTLDGLGRPIKIEGGNGSTTVSAAESVYDSCGCSPLGKLKQQAVAHAPGASPAYTTYTYDGIGRTLSVLAPDGVSTTSYAYSGNTVTVTDPAGMWKKLTMDVFGNLMQVNEPNPAGGSDYVTTYTYDVLGHLTGVSMTRGSTTQTRSFDYGSPPGTFLLAATNPENGTVHYTYNSYGKVATRVDAKNQEVAYTYDSYARLTKVQRYPTQNGAEDTCQQENYFYDTRPSFDTGYAQNILGRLAAVQYYGGNSPCDTTFTEMYNYGVPGAPVGKRLWATRNLALNYYPYSQTMNVDLDGAFSYDNEGRMTSEGYPTDNAGTTASLTLGIDSMGRLYSLTDQTSAQLIQSASYGPAGELTQIYGAMWGTENRSYNVMKQLTQLTSTPNNSGTGVSMSYNYSATQNNGKIVSDSDASYSYDSLNRLASAAGSGWNQSYTYDGFGNLTAITGTQPNSWSYDPSTNHGFCADANGNTQEISCAGYYGYTYDIENRIVNTGNSGGGFHYSYAPGNKRIWRGNGVTEELTFWSPSGQKLGTYALTATPGTYDGTYYGPYFYATQTGTNYYFGGKLIKNAAGWVYSDRLGSIGKYYPYGSDRGTGNPASGEKFATYSQDAETGLDYAINRYQQPGAGRFITPDPYAGSVFLGNPSTWNRYTYATDDPISHVDPGGLCDAVIAGITESSGEDSGEMQFATDRGGAEVAYPYAGTNVATGVAGVVLAPSGGISSKTAYEAIYDAWLNSNGGPMNIVTFSGGAAAFAGALPLLGSEITDSIASITYVSPGMSGTLPTVNGITPTVVLGTGPVDDAATSQTVIPRGWNVIQTTTCGHDFNCEILAAGSAIPSTTACFQTPSVFSAGQVFSSISYLSSLAARAHAPPAVPGLFLFPFDPFDLGSLPSVTQVTSTINYGDQAPPL